MSTETSSKKNWKDLTKKQQAEIRKEKLGQARSEFDSALLTLTDSDRYRDFIESAAACHSYSLRNTLWVLCQRGGSYIPPIAGFNTWKSQLGYQVRKGEQSAKVWVPVTFKVEDPGAGDADEHGKVKRVGFRPGPVFTRDQVDPIEGEALSIDPPPAQPVEGDSHGHLIALLHGFIEKRGMAFKDLEPDNPQNALGYHSKEENAIACRTDIAPNAQVRVLVHELIHSLGVSYTGYGRARAEVITDTATYLACRSIGIDLNKSSIPYVAGWAGSSASEVNDDIGLISKLADQVLVGSGLDRHLSVSAAEIKLRPRKSEANTTKNGAKTP